MSIDRDFYKVWVKIGLLSFGGPAGQIALMRDQIVMQRNSVSEENFQRGLDIAMLLPGPEAQQLATYLGWRMHGLAGGIIAGLSFILPGAVLMTILAAIAISNGETQWVSAIFYGIQAAVLVIVAKAVFGLMKKAATGPLAWALALAAFAALTFTEASFPLVILAAGVAGFLLFPRGEGEEARVGSWRNSVVTLAIGLSLIAAGVGLTFLTLPAVYADVATLFTSAAFVSFGGAYALLPYVAEHAVETHGWLSAADMLNGLALGEATPGPLILVNLYAGFHAGFGESGVSGGVLAAALTCLFTFLPSFTLMLSIAPHVDSIGRVPWARAALAGVSAAVVGVIAHLAVYLGQAALFPTGFDAPEWPKIALLAALALWAALRPVPITWLVGAGALSGLLLTFAGIA